MRSIFLSCCLLFITTSCVVAQGKCPANIGFEVGKFDGWECFSGRLARDVGTISSISATAPINNKHTLIANSNTDELDLYGKFPISCPNGSNFSIKLGNENTGAEVDGVSFTFTIPADQQTYSIIYNYAVVFQDPSHPDQQQPKFTAKVYDESTGNSIGCSSFSYTAASSLPGFKQSAAKDSVFYKDWTPVTIKLSGYAGKTIRLEFTTYDCAQGGHFGYAYVDVNQNCSSPIGGNVFCSKTEKLTLTAPFGFMEYKWYNEDFSKLLGTNNTLEFKPVPPPNTKYALAVVPYPEQGCTDTLYTTAEYSPEALDFKLQSTITSCVNPGADITAASIVAGSGNNLSYSYFTDATLRSYIRVPKKIITSGTYYVLAENVAGCTEAKTTAIHVEPLPKFSVADPERVYRPTTVNLTKTITAATKYSYTYWQDSLLTKTQALPEFIDKTGRYFIQGQSMISSDCVAMRPVNVKILDPIIIVPNIFSPNADGVNDDWRIPQLAYYPESIVELYNRSGKMLYRSTPGYTKPWDGKLNGQNLPIATYYYVIKLNDELPNIGGSVTIIR